jgi:MFS family permease
VDDRRATEDISRTRVANGGSADEPSSGYVNYVLGMVFLVAIFNVCDRTIMGLLVEEIKSDIGLDDRQIGLMMGLAFTVVHVGAAVPMGRIADRTSRRVVISLGLLVWSSMTVFAGLAQNALQLLMARMGVGLGEASGAAPSQSLIADYVAPSRRAKALSVVSVGGTIGLGVGMLIGGWVNQIWGWRAAFIIAGTPGIALAALFYLTVAEPRRGQSEDRVDSGDPIPFVAGVKSLMSRRSYRYMVIGACCAGVATYGRSLWEPTFLRRVYGMEPGEVGIAYFLIYAVPMALGSFIGGWLGDRLTRRDERWYMWLSAIANALGLPFALGFLFAPAETSLFGIPLAFWLGAAASFLGGIWSPQSMALAQALAPLRMRTVSAALWSSVFTFVGLGLGPYLVGEFNVQFEPRFGAEGIRYSLALMNIALLLSVVFQLMSSRTLRQDLESVRQLESGP